VDVPPSLPLPRGWPRVLRAAFQHAVALQRLALLAVRSGFENSPDPQAAQVAEIDRLREALAASKEVNRILRARLDGIPASRRPHYPPAERMAILNLRSGLGWSDAQTARELLVTPQTIANWRRRADEQGPDALVQTREPVNAYPDFVTGVVHELHDAAPGMGRRMLADVLARTGLTLAASTVERMKKRSRRRPTPEAPPPGQPEPERDKPDAASPRPKRVVTAKHPGHVFHVDITRVSTLLGFWVPWFPFCLLPVWPFCWHVALVLDQFSRSLVAFGIFKQEPAGADICALLDRAVVVFGRAPRHIVSDRGTQFEGEYRQWCRKNGAKPRFGAVGQHGSIAVLERLILSLKSELLWRILIPYSPVQMEAAVAAYQLWYNEHRPHGALGRRTPAEVRDGKTPAREQPRIETRARLALARASPGDATPPARRICGKLELVVTRVGGFRELPVVELREAA
jgi:putative transposase